MKYAEKGSFNDNFVFNTYHNNTCIIQGDDCTEVNEDSVWVGGGG